MKHFISEWTQYALHIITPENLYIATPSQLLDRAYHTDTHYKASQVVSNVQ